VADVYTGSPIVITAFFAVVPKLAGWVLLLKLSTFVLSAFVDFFSILFVLTGLLSLLIGSFGAVSQSSLKRILAFSAVAHAGYLLLGIAAFQTVSLVSNALYLFVYTLSLLPIFAILIVYFPRNISSNAIDTVYGLRYLYKQNRVAALILVLSLFSAAGVPPLSGFFAKLYVFFAVVSANYTTVAALALLLSSASAVYYLKVVRFAFFFRNFRASLLLQEITRPAAYAIALLFVLNISFFAWGSDFLVALCQIQSNFLL
jgi:NADH-quinone oxidoreductase subunit N